MEKQYLRLPVDELIPYENNPRINDEAAESVAKSIEQCGYIAPIITDEDMVILGGHTRLLAMQRLGIKECEVLVVSGLTEEQKRKYRLLDNKTAELAEWDWEMLENELFDLDFGDLELDWFDGFEEEVCGLDDVDDIEEDDFEEPDEDYEPIVQYGQRWKLGRHYLMCGDSTSMDDMSNLMGGVKADMMVTDPPYNVAYEGKTKDALKIENDSMGNEQFRAFLEDAFEVAGECLKAGAAFYIWHADSEGYNFRGACAEKLGIVRQCLVWAKNAMVLGRQDYQWRHEPCLYGWKDGASHYWASDRKQTTVLEFDKPQRNGEHPTMKPVPLFRYQIENSSKRGQVVLDPFGGSGTTLVAAEECGRIAYTMELDPKYCDVIIARWEKLTGEKAELVG